MTFIHVSDSYKQDHKIELPCEKNQHLLLLDEEAIHKMLDLCISDLTIYPDISVRHLRDFFELILEEGRQPQEEEIS